MSTQQHDAGSEAGLIETASLGAEHWTAVVLVAVTGVLHLYAGVVEGAPPVLIAGVGFFGALALFLVGYRRRLLYAVGVVYTGVQIPLWYVVKAGAYTPVGYVDKAVQVVLVALLLGLLWRDRST
ncbi:hypothetical protein [Halorientalis marina]|uniref:hypothetical protein n=1 Tax=Halorientalis marina TaxID=2931976 RepID=UPI001FF4BAD8|nr:hypothetical protein [Halorientalis marina]